MEDYILPLLAVLMAVGVLQTSYLVYRTLNKDKRNSSNSIFVDTSVLMDGRVLEVAKAGFITGELVIPRTVIGELQLLSDGGDSGKRTRARHGLDVARELRTMDSVEAKLLQDGSSAPEGVDERLLRLAKKHGGSIMTIDFNLNKVAQVEGIQVMNINELAKVIRAEHLPGERYTLSLIQKGQNAQQAVGYTEDGIMVVVDNAQKKIGTTVDIEITRSIQTDAGRMLFAKIVDEAKIVPTPKPGITKKLLGGSGRQRTKSTKQEATKKDTKKDTLSSKPNELKPTHSSKKAQSNRSHKKLDHKEAADKPTKSQSSSRSDSRPVEKKAPVKSASKPIAAKSASTSVLSSSRQNTQSSARLYSSRSDSAPAEQTDASSGDKTKSGPSKTASASKSSPKPSRASRPTPSRNDTPAPKKKARKNPEEDLMALLNSK